MTDTRGENLIFLISQPRAGSTLLQLMLAGHPEIATTSEPWIALNPVYALREAGVEAEYNPGTACRALREFLKQGGMDEGFYRGQVASFLLGFYRRAAGRQNKRFFLDKTPRYYHIIPELMEVFPGAKFIILIRNPLAVLSSVLKTWAIDDPLFLVEYKEDLMLAPQLLLDCLKDHPQRSFRVGYEELVSGPEEALKGICGFLGVSYSAEMLDYGGRLDKGSKLGDHVGVRKASRATAGSLDKWKKGLASAQNRLFALSYLEELGPALIKELGYDYGELKSSIGARPEGDAGLVSWETIKNYNRPEAERDAVLKSLSWRLTAPFRVIGRLLKR